MISKHSNSARIIVTLLFNLTKEEFALKALKFNICSRASIFKAPFPLCLNLNIIPSKPKAL